MIKKCASCGSDFELTDVELTFYEKEGPCFGEVTHTLPIPKFCFRCRRQRRIIFRNNSNMYMRPCDLTGKKVPSLHHPGKPYKVYYHRDWWDQVGNQLDYGRDFDFTRPFFEQYLDLRNAVPVESTRILNCENSEYGHNVRKCENCYFVWGVQDGEDCFYIDGGASIKNVIVGWQVTKAEVCHHIYQCQRVFNCYHCYLCFGCSDLYFCKLCKDCNHCFGCCELRHRSYCIFNKQYSKKDYQDFISKINFGSRKVVSHWREKTLEFFYEIPEPPLRGFNNEDVTGDIVYHSKRCRHILTATYCEDSKYLFECNKVDHSCELDNTTVATGLCYHTVHCTTVFDCMFCVFCNNCSDCLYLMDCTECKRCFGCVGLYNCEYCVFNKQYSKEDYEALVPRIIEYMISTREWGEMFPPYISRYGYNETAAIGDYPLTREQAKEKGFNWNDYIEPRPAFPNLIRGCDMPDDIADVPDSILECPIECEQTGKRFKIQKPELEFRRQFKMPPPTVFPKNQLSAIYRLRNPLDLFPGRQCANVTDGKRCPKTFECAHVADSPQKIFCWDCYHNISYQK